MSCETKDFQFDGMKVNEKPNDVGIFYDSECNLRISRGSTKLMVNNSGPITTISGYEPSYSDGNSYINKLISEKCNGLFESTHKVTDAYIQNKIYKYKDKMLNTGFNIIDNNKFTITERNKTMTYTKDINDNYWYRTSCFEPKCPDNSISTSLLSEYKNKNEKDRLFINNFDSNSQSNYPICIEDKIIECDKNRPYLTEDVKNNKCIYATNFIDVPHGTFIKNAEEVILG